jgi:murein tripeptide amidase MpaA
MKNFIIGVMVLALIGIGFYLLTKNDAPQETVVTDTETNTETSVTPTPNTPTEEPEEPVTPETETVIGSSIESRDIVAYHYGTGNKELLFIGGIHAGYSWNTVLVAHELMAYLEANPEKIPEGYRATVIPVLNPDGLFKVTGSADILTAPVTKMSLDATIPGRFNARTVDLNRNFDCEWSAEGTWQNRKVSGGATAFSEPESQAIRSYIESHDVAGAVVWYSAAGGVFASTCKNGILPETQTLTNLYAKASGYKAYQEFNFYEITGDMVNWFAQQRIPAISVLLSTHTDVEWDKNRVGIDAFLNHFAE